MIRKLLIANRGEIAVRIARTARRMGIATVAVYSDADANAMHVHACDEAVHLGASEPTHSYLRADRILEAARSKGADAIHPGYGFLSERAEFSEACSEAGIVFIGPPGRAMRRLGSKIEAKQLAVENGVPITPGYFEPGATADDIAREADRIGYPVMLKASAGGGGRGMRVVRDPAKIREEFALAADEALKGFGDDAMMVEKLIEQPRHIEVQAIADQHGNVACLFERECSIQRRHQKLLEEAPSPYVQRFPETWARMKAASEQLIRSSGYYGAGTIEFMLDEASGEFYFLEVNARLQVEHPVTESITGLDLVELQLRIGSGEVLDIRQELLAGDRVAISGHCIEARIVAEDPAKGFLPSIGKILAWAEPKHPGVRVDTGFNAESEVSRFYDSMIAKVIASGPTREAAISRLESALRDFHVLGVNTNIAYLLDVLAHPDFRAGRMDTGFLGREFSDWMLPAPSAEVVALAMAAKVGNRVESTGEARRANRVWDLADGFRNARVS